VARDVRGSALVGAQVVCVSALAWPGPPLWRLPLPVRAGAVLAVVAGNAFAAAGSLRLGRHLAALPAPREDAVLRTDGAYGVVRHPIYAGILVAATGGAVHRARPEPLVAVALLSAVLHVKAAYEERLLRGNFGAAYDAYAARVPRLLPFPRPSSARRPAHHQAAGGIPGR
jgi:protein-S-isoprenylcysteine O-methyltransferase Ste14